MPRKSNVGAAPKPRVGLKEIAQAADVSVATASRVLNGNSRVDAEIRRAVLREARRLGIDLATRNKNKTLAFILNNRAMLHEFHSRILVGAEAQCAANGWDMVFFSFNYSPHIPWAELHLPQAIQRSDFTRGVILAGTTSMNLIELLAARGISFAVLGNNVLGASDRLQTYDVVFADDVQGAADATRHLIMLGHRYIVFVGNTRLPWFARCFEGYRRAMSEAGLKPNQSATDSEDDVEVGYLSTKSLLARSEPVTAILAGNDPTAHGVYKCVRERHLAIPSDISIAGCDDTVGAWLDPALSTIREFPEQLGKQLVEVVLNRISHPDHEPRHITVPTEFLQRGSCGPPSLKRTDR